MPRTTAALFLVRKKTQEGRFLLLRHEAERTWVTSREVGLGVGPQAPSLPHIYTLQTPKLMLGHGSKEQPEP